MFQWLPHIDNSILAFNLIDMAATCLLPFATVAFSSNTGSTAAVAFFGFMSIIICCARLLTLYWARAHKLLVQPAAPEEGSQSATDGRTWPTPEEAFIILRVRLIVLLVASIAVVAMCFAVGTAGSIMLFALPLAPALAKYIPLPFFKPLKRQDEVCVCVARAGVARHAVSSGQLSGAPPVPCPSTSFCLFAPARSRSGTSPAFSCCATPSFPSWPPFWPCSWTAARFLSPSLTCSPIR